MSLQVLLLSFFLIFLNTSIYSQVINGFDLSDTSIPSQKIYSGGPPKDGIPSIDQPKFLGADKADYPAEQDRVLGVYLNGIAKAYPIGILNYHEIVNDNFGSDPIVITYCPLCGSGIAFDADIGGKGRTFGVSGLLYNSDVLMYDRETGSLWSQILTKGISGPMKNVDLEIIPTSSTTWKAWKEKYPNTLVLTKETGHFRNYDRTPYTGYDKSTILYFPVDEENPIFHTKEKILGIEIKGKYKAYPFTELGKVGEISDSFQGKTLTIQFDKDAQWARVLDQNGEEFPSYISYWFAWWAFHPDTKIYRSK